jgi:hypothetical protein
MSFAKIAKAIAEWLIFIFVLCIYLTPILVPIVTTAWVWMQTLRPESLQQLSEEERLQQFQKNMERWQEGVDLARMGAFLGYQFMIVWPVRVFMFFMHGIGLGEPIEEAADAIIDSWNCFVISVLVPLLK